MPLNIKDTEPNGPRPPEGPRGEQVPGNQKMIYPWLLLILILSSGVFLLFQFGILSPRGEIETTPSPAAQQGPGSTRGTAPDTAVHVRIPAEEPAPPPPENPVKGIPDSEGGYTIVISAFNRSADAEELAGRWTKAGFDAGVQQTKRWYRVTLGRFRNVSEARVEAERLREAFEEGYWITRSNL